MAPSRPAPLALPFLALLALLAAAQTDEPFPPSQQQQQKPPTNASDAAALREVFRRWGLEGDASAAGKEDPCSKRAWVESLARNASVGCSCSGSECRVTHLNVTGFWNITEIPLALFNLTELVTLDLSNNNLSGSIPPEVGNLSKLETCTRHFNNNHLGGSFPPESSRLTNLQSLWMFDNYIEGPVPQFIENLTNLTDLRIYGMKLRGPVPKIFSNLMNLEKLMLGDLEGGQSSFDFIADWPNLSILSLRNCGLIGHLPTNLPNLPELKYLDLRLNDLSGPIQPLSPYKYSTYLYVGENNFSGPLPSEIVQSSRALDVSHNPSLSGTLPDNPAGRKWSINYIGTSIDASRTIDRYPVSSFAVNCGGEQKHYSDPLPTVFSEDSSDLGAAGIHVNTVGQWVVSHVGSDPFSESPGIVNTSQDILGTNMTQLYKTARTSTSALSYYMLGLADGKYTVQLFFAEIVIVDEPGRRLFNIDIQDQNIKKDFDIIKEAGGPRRPTSITHETTVNNSILVIHLYWTGRGTCCIPYEGAYGPLVSAIKLPLSKTQRSVLDRHRIQHDAMTSEEE
ncbi:hypothetical protein ACP70R_042362 [Stipagrostis hirtigluma subsp. patula]